MGIVDTELARSCLLLLQDAGYTTPASVKMRSRHGILFLLAKVLLSVAGTRAEQMAKEGSRFETGGDWVQKQPTVARTEMVERAERWSGCGRRVLSVF
jgi:hypothetical protein